MTLNPTHKSNSSCLGLYAILQPRVLRSFATHRDNFTSKSISNQIEMNLTKEKEVFVNHIPKNKILLQFIHNYYNLGDMQRDLRLISQEYLISCFSHYFVARISRIWERISKLGERFFLKTTLFTKPSPGFVTGIIVKEISLHL